jgi:hypothetical protein
MFCIINLHRSFSFIPIGKFLVIDNCKKIHSPLLHELINLFYVYLKFCKYASQDNWTPNILSLYLLDFFFLCCGLWFKYSQICFFVHALSFVTQKKKNYEKRAYSWLFSYNKLFFNPKYLY